MFSSHLLVAYQ